MIFPLKFCGTRWIEDAAVADRAVICWENIKKYVKKVVDGPKSKIPKCPSFKTVELAVNDPLTPTKLQVFIYVANLMKPFWSNFKITHHLCHS